MATREDIEQFKAFARVDGAIVGGLWILSFALFVGEFHNPLLGLPAMIAGVASVVVAALRLRRYRNEALDGVMSFRRAFGYGVLTYAYAALLMAAAQYVYFQFIDHGFLISRYVDMTTTDEFKAMTKLYGLRSDDVKQAIDALSALRPIDIALQFFTTNIMLGVMISLPVAAIMKSRKKN